MYFYAPQKARGFTLIELLVVVAIIAILTSIITVSFGAAKKKSRDSKRAADIKSIQLALSLYYSDNLFYPKNIYASSNTISGSDPANGLAPTYLPVVPKDPNANTTDTCNGTGANGLASCYHYNAYVVSGLCSVSNVPVIYHLGASFEDTTNSVLNQDSDAAPALNPPFSTTYVACNNGTSPSGTFDGNAADCAISVGAAATDNCYDLTP
ncbi:type II secretion system protein [Candidatus Kaiserbacteria bacterium]|nr:type II secretion system protein [Candidatus Kaiserbacteria bacterium]